MYTSVNDRIREIANKLYNGNITAMAKGTFISRTTINSIIGEKEVSPGYEIIRRIAEMSSHKINLDWLITGEGEMLKNSTSTEGNKQLALQERTERNSLKYYYELSATASNIENISDNELNQPYTLINFPGYEGCVGFNVAGESMYPTMKERDIVAIKPEKIDFIVNGEIYLVVTRDGQRMIKRLCVLSETEEDGLKIKCISDNPNQELYAPFTIYGKDVHNIFRVKGTISTSFFE